MVGRRIGDWFNRNITLEGIIMFVLFLCSGAAFIWGASAIYSNLCFADKLNATEICSVKQEIVIIKDELKERRINDKMIKAIYDKICNGR